MRRAVRKADARGCVCVHLCVCVHAVRSAGPGRVRACVHVVRSAGPGHVRACVRVVRSVGPGRVRACAHVWEACRAAVELCIYHMM